MLLQCPLVKQQVFKSNSAFNETKTNSEKHYNADRKYEVIIFPVVFEHEDCFTESKVRYFLKIKHKQSSILLCFCIKPNITISLYFCFSRCHNATTADNYRDIWDRWPSEIFLRDGIQQSSVKFCDSYIEIAHKDFLCSHPFPHAALHLDALLRANVSHNNVSYYFSQKACN